MRTRLSDRRFRAVVGLVLAGVASSVFVAPVQAQASGRFRVLVPALEGSKSGAKVAEQVRKSIDQMATHIAIPEKEVKAAVKKLGAKEAEMDCLKYRQLMSHVEAKLVMCGAIDAAGQVTAQFYNPDGTSYDVPPFAFGSEAAAAQQITQAFGAYNEMVRVLAFCDDYLNSSQWQDALNQCGKAAELNPKSGRAHYAKGLALRALERHEEALATFQKTLELDPINAEALTSAAIEASALGQTELSDKYWNEYLELNPGDANVRLSIASKAAKEGDFRGALTILEASGKSDTTNVALREYSGHFAMGAASKAMTGAVGEVPAAAKEMFQRAVAHYTFLTIAKGDSIDVSILRNLMVAQAGLGNTQEALAWGKRATEHPTGANDSLTWTTYADQLRTAGRNDESLVALGRLSQIAPSFPVAYRRAQILLELNRINDAVAAVKQGRGRNEISDATSDQLAQAVMGKGFEQHQAKRYEQAYSHYDAGREIATSAKVRSMANYLQGYGIYEQAVAIASKNTVAGARQALPMFQRAKTLLENSTAYNDGGAAAGRASLLKAVDQYIERLAEVVRING